MKITLTDSLFQASNDTDMRLSFTVYKVFVYTLQQY